MIFPCLLLAHRWVWVLAAMAMGKDYAEEPGLSQAFPVLAPLSSKAVAPQDIRTPAEVWGKMLEKEHRHDAWSHERDRARAALAHQHHKTRGFRESSDKAEKAAVRAETSTADRVADLEKAVAERRKKMEDEVRAMKLRMQQALEVEAEVKAECSSRAAETRTLVLNEQSHTREVEAMLEQEKRHTQEMIQRVEEVEQQARQAIATRDKEVEAVRVDAAARLSKAKAVSSERVMEIEVRAQEELQGALQRKAQVEYQCEGRLKLEVVRKDKMETSAKEQIEVATKRFDKDEHAAKRHLVERQDDCSSLVSKVQQREQNTEVFVQGKVSDMSAAFKRAEKKSGEAARREQHSEECVQHAAHVLGQHYSSRHQYNPAVDGKLGAALTGCLHGYSTSGPAPSPQTL